MNYQKSWEAMNDLEMCISKICSAREILNCAIDKSIDGEKAKSETLMCATDELLELYIKEFDEKFKAAWNEVIVNQKEVTYKDDIDYMANDFLTSNFPNENTSKTWYLPVEVDSSGDYFLTFPADLLEAVGLEEGDEVDWVDNGNGSYVLKKVDTSQTVPAQEA